MVRYGTDLPDCPVETTLLLIGNKWTVIIGRELLAGGDALWRSHVCRGREYQQWQAQMSSVAP